MGRSAIHPGEHLAEQFEVLSISAAELGRRLDVPANRITAIINGQRSITGDTALRLGHFFGNSPQFWLNLQAIYDLRTAEEAVGKKIQTLPTLTELLDTASTCRRGHEASTRRRAPETGTRDTEHCHTPHRPPSRAADSCAPCGCSGRS
jgi:addiction module HigA family antidote